MIHKNGHIFWQNFYKKIRNKWIVFIGDSNFMATYWRINLKLATFMKTNVMFFIFYDFFR